MSTTAPAAGWYPDPSNPAGGSRWWDGTQWTADVRPSPNASPPSVAPYESAPAMPGQASESPMSYGQAHPQAAPGAPMSYGQPPGQYPLQHGQPQYSQGLPQAQAPAYGPRVGRAGGRGGARSTFARRNQLSLTAAGLATLYFFLAISTHFVLLGIAPALMCVRAFQRKEQLAPLALVAAIVAIGTAIVFFR